MEWNARDIEIKSIVTLTESRSVPGNAPHKTKQTSMAWAPRLSAGAGSSAMHMNVRDAVEILRSFLEASPDMNDFEWSSDARDAILTHVYKTFWGTIAIAL